MLMHFCTCRINLTGQNYHIVEILPTEPMSWPEVQLMFAEHGEENVFDIKPVSTRETTPVLEKQRLEAKYRAKDRLIERVFPGRSPQMEMLMPGEQESQPRADEYGIAEKDDVAELAEHGLEPPVGPAIIKAAPVRRSFPAEG